MDACSEGAVHLDAKDTGSATMAHVIENDVIQVHSGALFNRSLLHKRLTLWVQFALQKALELACPFSVKQGLIMYIILHCLIPVMKRQTWRPALTGCLLSYLPEWLCKRALWYVTCFEDIYIYVLWWCSGVGIHVKG